MADQFPKKSEENTDDKGLPNLHQQAFKLKNRKRLQRDGGRAWIQDSQLHEAREGGNLYLETDTKDDE